MCILWIIKGRARESARPQHHDYGICINNYGFCMKLMYTYSLTIRTQPTIFLKFNSSGFSLLFIGAYQLLCWLFIFFLSLPSLGAPKRWNYFRLIFFFLSNYRSAFWLKFNEIKDVFTLYFLTGYISWTKSIGWYNGTLTMWFGELLSKLSR